MTAYLYTLSAIERQKLVADKTASFVATTGKNADDFLAFAVQVILKRLEKNAKSYVQYGVYWSSLKEVLMKYSDKFKSPAQQSVIDIYRGDDDLQTVILADDFRTMYMATQLQGTNRFMITTDGDMLSVFDEEMEFFK